MSPAEKIKRLNATIKETEELLALANVKYQNSIKFLEMEIAENKELGNDESANDHAYEYVKERKNRVNELKNHIKRLEQMKLTV
jgi:hypothetical protein